MQGSRGSEQCIHCRHLLSLPACRRPIADDSSLLAILLDLSPAAVAQLASAVPGLSLQSLLEQLLTFVNAFAMLNDANQLAVFTAGATACSLAYCSPSCLPPSAAADAAAAAAAGAPSAAVLEGLQQAISASMQAGQGGIDGRAACQLSSALSRVLCFINSQQRRAGESAAGGMVSSEAAAQGVAQRRQQPTRVLCLSAAHDVPSQYIAVMNAIFSAQVRRGMIVRAFCSNARCARCVSGSSVLCLWLLPPAPVVPPHRRGAPS